MQKMSAKFSRELLLDILSGTPGGGEIVAVERVHEEPGVAENQNFLSQVIKVRVDLKLVGDRLATRNLFVKYGELGRKKSGFVIQKVFFDVEAKAYEFLKYLSAWMQKECNKIEKYWADCFYTSIDQNIFIIMLQDLTESGYSMMRDGRGLLDRDHVLVATDRLARFHAMSRLYISRQPPDTSDWPEPRFYFLKTYHKNGLLALAKAVRKYKETWNYIADYLVELSEFYYEKYLKCFQSIKNDFPVFCLGDCWSNNILFKYSDDDNKPVDARFIDFQFAYINGFAWDLHYLLYITLLPKTRLENMAELLKNYQQVFAQTTADLGGEPHLVPTLEQVNITMDKLLLSQFLYSAISAVEIYSAEDEDYENAGSHQEAGCHIRPEWFLTNPVENGYMDNIAYFESKGLFKKA